MIVSMYMIFIFMVIAFVVIPGFIIDLNVKLTFITILFIAIDQWQRTGWETNNNWLMVDGFDDGWKYDIRVVASNGGIYETGSATESIFPTATSSMSHNS